MPVWCTSRSTCPVPRAGPGWAGPGLQQANSRRFISAGLHCTACRSIGQLLGRALSLAAHGCVQASKPGLVFAAHTARVHSTWRTHVGVRHVAAVYALSVSTTACIYVVHIAKLIDNLCATLFGDLKRDCSSTYERKRWVMGILNMCFRVIGKIRCSCRQENTAALKLA